MSPSFLFISDEYFSKTIGNLCVVRIFNCISRFLLMAARISLFQLLVITLNFLPTEIWHAWAEVHWKDFQTCNVFLTTVFLRGTFECSPSERKKKNKPKQKNPTTPKRSFQFKGDTDCRFSYTNPIVYLNRANLPCISLGVTAILFLLSPWWHLSAPWLSRCCCLQSCAVKTINTMTQVRNNYPRIKKKKKKA